MKNKITKRDALFYFLGAMTAGLIYLFIDKSEKGRSFRDYVRNTFNRIRVF